MPRAASKYTRRVKPVLKRLNKGVCLSLCKLLLAALPTIVFGLFTIVFSLQQDASARATREQDQRQADETHRRIIFKEYIDDMKELLLDEHFDEHKNQSLLQMRIQTLTVLRQLDPPRKYDVILFLYENRLIRHDQPPTIDLSGANLTGVKFSLSSMATCNLPFLYLPRVYAKGIVFEGCALENGIFDHATMTGAKFDSCSLSGSSFIKTNLTEARFSNNFVFQASFMGAQITRAVIRKGIIMDTNLVNVDLYQSDINEFFLKTERTSSATPNRILNTRFPNGTFSEIDGNDLIIDGRAEPFCHNNITHRWTNVVTQGPTKIINMSRIVRSAAVPMPDDCFFRIDANNSVGQHPSLDSFTALVDQMQAMYNLSLWIGLVNATDQDTMTIMVHYAQEGGAFDFTNSPKHIIQNPPLLQFYSIVDVIPPKVTRLYISMSCNATRNRERFCFFTHVTLTIFKIYE